MVEHKGYHPGPARGAEVRKDGDDWTLIVLRDLRHSPEKVWLALTDPEQLREWAPFDSDSSLDETGATVNLSTVGTPKPHITETRIIRADAPMVLEYAWGGQHLKWELVPIESGTRLTLWHKIDRHFIAMGAAGWHICFDVLERHLDGNPLGRMVGPDAIRFGGWTQLHQEYADQFGVTTP